MVVKFTARGSIAELMTLNNLLQESSLIDGIKVGRLYRGKDPNQAHQFFEVLAQDSESYRWVSRKRDTSGYVYLLETAEQGVYKIGKTKDPNDRRKTFGVLLPFQCEMIHTIESDNMHALEKRLHLKFEREGKRIAGTEFFNLTERDVRYLCSL